MKAQTVPAPKGRGHVACGFNRRDQGLLEAFSRPEGAGAGVDITLKHRDAWHDGTAPASLQDASISSVSRG